MDHLSGTLSQIEMPELSDLEWDDDDLDADFTLIGKSLLWDLFM